MRVSKEPAERRQEILDTAMRLFWEKGYEKTSIADIAQAIGVAQGLCYRYFSSKEDLLEAGLEQYAHHLVQKMLPEDAGAQTLKEQIMALSFFAEDEQDDYYALFHQTGNPKIHDQLAMRVCAEALPLVTDRLRRAQASGEIQLPDVEAAASFCVYGQLGILLRADWPQAQRSQKIQAFLCYMLKL